MNPNLFQQEIKIINEFENLIGVSIPKVKNIKNKLGYVVENNHITQLSVISKFKTKKFYIKKLKKIPDNIGNLKALEILNLSNNNIEELPESFTNLTSLKRLFLNKNQLKFIPNYINKLIKLDTLILESNNINKIDNLIGLKNLKTLNLTRNDIFRLPQNIFLLNNLKNLDLSFNKIEVLPNNFTKLKNLEKINLSHNPLRGLPLRIDDLENLIFLNLSHLNNLYLDESIVLKLNSKRDLAIKTEFWPYIEKESYIYDSNEISVYEYNFKIPEKKFHTIIYGRFLKWMQSRNIQQIPLKDALNWYFNFCGVSNEEKSSITEICYCIRSRIIMIKRDTGNDTFQRKRTISRNTGWYFYVTGSEIGKSEISKQVDQLNQSNKNIKIFYKKLQNLTLTNKEKSNLYKLGIKNFERAFLLKLGNKNILLDAHLSKESIILIKEKLEKKNKTLDAVFISHSHNDHSSGIFDIIKIFPDILIIMSYTTLEFIIIKTGFKNQLKRKHKELIKRAILVQNYEKVVFNNLEFYFQFFFAGHMPGALMLFFEIFGYRFLYTGDFSFYDLPPIPGVNQIISSIPSPIHFLLIEGVFINNISNTFDEQTRFFYDTLDDIVKEKSKMLIGADPGSIAIILYLFIDKYYRELIYERKLQNRPNFYLNKRIKENIQILCSRTQDIHPQLCKKIENQINPFSSAMIKWISNNNLDEERIIQLLNKEDNALIVIFDPSDLSMKLNSFKRSNNMRYFLRIIGLEEKNYIYLAGAIRSKIGIELISGNKDLELIFVESIDDNQIPIEINRINFHNSANVLNISAPENIFNLHGDKFQLFEMFDKLKPEKVCFFHTSPRELIPIRKEIKNRFPFIKKIYAFHSESKSRYIYQEEFKKIRLF